MSDPLGGTAADAPSRHRRDPLAPPWYMRPLVWALAFIMELMSLRQYRAPKPEPQKGYTLSDLYELKREMEESRWTSNEGAGPYWAIEFFAPIEPSPGVHPAWADFYNSVMADIVEVLSNEDHIIRGEN